MHNTLEILKKLIKSLLMNLKLGRELKRIIHVVAWALRACWVHPHKQGYNRGPDALGPAGGPPHFAL